MMTNNINIIIPTTIARIFFCKNKKLVAYYVINCISKTSVYFLNSLVFMRLYDAHCHLNEEHVFPRREEFLQRFVDVGGKGIVNTGASDFYNQK
jgi:hypothetical protein